MQMGLVRTKEYTYLSTYLRAYRWGWLGLRNTQTQACIYTCTDGAGKNLGIHKHKHAFTRIQMGLVRTKVYTSTRPHLHAFTHLRVFLYTLQQMRYTTRD